MVHVQNTLVSGITLLLIPQQRNIIFLFFVLMYVFFFYHAFIYLNIFNLINYFLLEIKILDGAVPKIKPSPILIDHVYEQCIEFYRKTLLWKQI